MAVWYDVGTFLTERSNNCAHRKHDYKTAPELKQPELEDLPIQITSMEVAVPKTLAIPEIRT